MTIQVLNLLDITIEVSVLIIIITIIRIKLKEYLSPNAIYFLWIFVLLCTLIPVRLGIKVVPEADVQNIIAGISPSVINNIPLVKVTDISDSVTPEMPADDSGIVYDTEPIPNNLPETENNTEDVPANLPEPLETGYGMEDLPMQMDGDSPDSSIPLPYLIWGLVAAAMAVYIAVVNIRLHLYARHNREEVGICEEHIKIYSLKGYNCLMGIFSPAIYIDEESLKEDVLIDNIIRHEYQHYRVKDNIWQFFRIACLILQWHNPFMWWAYYASKRDCELACDMRVVRNMTKEERYLYGDSLLAVLKQRNKRVDNALVATSMGETGRRMKERIKLIMKFKYENMIIPTVIIACMIGVASLFALNIIVDASRQAGDEDISKSTMQSDSAANDDAEEDGKRIQININIEDYYSTNIGWPGNLYHIDEEGVLWGCGRNQYGQLGQGTQDPYDEKTEEMAKIAENVIHVDYSQQGFTVFLTEDHKLYGMGTYATGALLEYIDISELSTATMNSSKYVICTPKLLMENVVYARCGAYGVVCLDEDGGVWKLGTGILDGIAVEPEKVLDNAVFVAGGSNYAALLQDGSVWTWGYNFGGHCGVDPDDAIFIWYPVKVAEDAVMVWVDTTEYNVEFTDISEADKYYNPGSGNTIILKNDGTYWACGWDLGEERLVHGIGVESMYDDYYMVCSSEFIRVMSADDLTPYPEPDILIPYHKPEDVDDDEEGRFTGNHWEE